MKISIINVGRVRQKFVLEGEKEYLQRFKAGFDVELLELGIESPESMAVEQIMEREAVALEKKLKNGGYVILLDQRGKNLNSESFAAVLQDRMNAGSKQVWFIIGGAYGTSDRIRKNADLVVSLSPLTFPHQLTRLILVEQIYRTQGILAGTGYHK